MKDKSKPVRLSEQRGLTDFLILWIKSKKLCWGSIAENEINIEGELGDYLIHFYYIESILK